MTEKDLLALLKRLEPKLQIKVTKLLEQRREAEKEVQRVVGDDERRAYYSRIAGAREDELIQAERIATGIKVLCEVLEEEANG